jgi:hypothetical protein
MGVNGVGGIGEIAVQHPDGPGEPDRRRLPAPDRPRAIWSQAFEGQPHEHHRLFR